MSYRIQNFRKVDHSTVKASFDIDFGAVRVNGFNLIASNNGTFISEPSEKYEKDGQTKYKKIAEFADDMIKHSVRKDIDHLYSTAPDPTGGPTANHPAAADEAPW